MINGRTYYDILDLPKYGINDNGERISYESIERAYNKLRYGIGNGEGRASIEEMRQINEAIRILSRQETRNEYDASLRNNEYITNEQEVQEDMLIEENEEVIEEVETPIVTPEQEEMEEPVIEQPEQEVPEQEEVIEEVEAPIVTPEQEEIEQSEQEVPEQEIPEQEENIEEIEENLNNEIDKELEKELQELDSIDPNYEKRKENRKRILKNFGIIGLSALAGPIGIITSSIILIKKGKFKLQKIDKQKIIKSIQTEETKIIEAASTKFEEEIDSLLNKPLTNIEDNYRLEIAKLKYQNQIDLLKQRIEFKESEVNKLETKVSNRLKKLALKMRLEAANKWLELRKLKAEKKLDVLNDYEPNSKKDDKLSKLNKNIENLKNEIISGKLKDSEKYRKKIKLQKLNQKRLEQIEKLKSQRCGIARNQVVLAVFDSIKNKFSSTPVDGEYVEVEENTKTR